MIETTQPPSRLLKIGIAATKWALGLVVSAWIVIAMVWGALHFLIVPRIAELRPMAEQYASKALGVQVRLGAIAATSNGFIPSFEITDITLTDAQKRQVLHLPRVLVAVSPRSAMTLGLEQLYIDRPVLDMRRTPDGRLWVAGLVVSSDDKQHNPATDWVFSQAEFAIRHGTVNWTDETRDVPTLTLTDVDLVLRNGLRSHAMQLNATPPALWGQRFAIGGQFKPSLLSRHPGDWKQWQGEIYADLPLVDVAQMGRYLDVGVQVTQGAGAVRAWIDVHRGAIAGATVDVALTQVDVRVDPALEPVALQQVSGRLGTKILDGGYEVFTQALQFDTQDGLRWPGGNLRLSLLGADTRTPARGTLVADRLDLAAMAQIADRMPLDAQVRGTLERLGPKGLVEQIQASWSGPLTQPVQLTAKGRVVQLEIKAAEHTATHTPGVKGADVDFKLTPTGGQASIVIKDGSFDANGVFEDSVIPVDQLSGEVRWKIDDQRTSVSVANLRFSNADAQGELQAKWHSADVVTPKAAKEIIENEKATHSPGVLDLQGSLSRAQGTQIHRYLPLALSVELREYLHDAILAGTGSNVKFKVKGNLQDFPFSDPTKGEFRISANVQGASFAFAPPRIMPKNSLPWPTLAQLSGELIIDHTSLQVKNAGGSVLGAPGLQFPKVDAVISNLYSEATLVVNAQARGPLADGLGLVNGSPLAGLTKGVLAQASATGPADYRFKLTLPIHAVEKAKVQGAVTLAGNDLQISNDTPRLSGARGVVAFSETGFTVTAGQARALGGDVRVEGGLSVQPGAASATLRMQGVATAEGLRQASELGALARLGQYASGQTNYSVALGLRGGVTELQINSTLQGLGLRLPAPLSKAEDTVLPLRLDSSAVRSVSAAGVAGIVAGQDQLQLDLGRLANIIYVRDVSGPTPRVLRGAIGVGLAADEWAPLPEKGVVANINMDIVDLDAWSQVLSAVAGTDLAGAPITPPATPTATQSDASQSISAANTYLPTIMAVRARELTAGGRKLSNVVVGGSRDGLLWRANLDASQLSGYIEYRQSSDTSAGRLYGRLARLAIEQSTAQEVESLLDQQPTTIPALDVVVEDFELRGKKLGTLEIDAVNLGALGPRDPARDNTAREWRLNRFNLTTPEAVLTASGNWTDINAQGPTSGAAQRNIKEHRRTVMKFKLDIADSGELLERFGMVGVLRKGSGKIEGRVDWLGSPITPDYASLGGNFNVNLENGQFLKAEPGIAKLLGVLSLQALPRRLVLDFRDVFTEGFSFDFLRGDVMIEKGIARTNNLQMKGVNAAVLMEGQADIAKETQSIKVVVVPEINAGSASLIASVINPLVGLSTFLAQLILRSPLIESNTQEFFVDGTWLDPRVTKVARAPPPVPAKTGEPK